MSTSQLYHNQDMKGVKYLRTSYAGGKTIYYGEISDNYIKCSKCQSHNVVRSGGVTRTLRLLPTGARHNQLRLSLRDNIGETIPLPVISVEGGEVL